MIRNWTRHGRGVALCALFAILLLVLWGGFALAQGDAAASEGPRQRTMLDNLRAAGWVGMVIIAVSIAGLSLVITFAMQLRRNVMVPPDLLAHLEGLFEEEDYDAALEVAESQPCFLSTVIAAGLPKIDRPYPDIVAAMEEAGDREANRIQQRVGYLSLISANATMLGLFGTVTGMVGAFNVIASSKTSPKPAELADGIQQALMTTVLGLMVAIPMSVAYVIFRNRVNNVIEEVSSIATEMMERFDSVGGK
jgi:biopolymer transport protein ExbB